MRKTNLNTISDDFAAGITAVNSPGGFTFVETIISMLVLAILVSILYAGLIFVTGTAKRSTNETVGNMRVVKTLELISNYSYDMTSTNYFPVEYITDNNGDLVYAITTTMSEVSSPSVHKNITVDYTWKEGGIQRHTRYYFVKPE